VEFRRPAGAQEKKNVAVRNPVAGATGYRASALPGLSALKRNALPGAARLPAPGSQRALHLVAALQRRR
jgi:hypothetical protein